jgi:hypothetical protein
VLRKTPGPRFAKTIGIIPLCTRAGKAAASGAAAVAPGLFTMSNNHLKKLISRPRELPHLPRNSSVRDAAAG